MVVHGTRGNGKSSLLAELGELARQEGARVRALAPDPSDSRGRHAPWVLMGSGKPPGGALLDMLGLSGILSGNHSSRPAPLIESANELHSLASSGPLVLLADDAHEMPPDFARAVYHIAQSCVSSRHRFLAVFAGTSKLPGSFHPIRAGFMERAPTIEVVRLGSDDYVREALSVPAKDSGFPIDEDALEHLVRHSHRYPTFIQMLGAESWKAARERNGCPGRITIEDARAGTEKAGALRDVFFEDLRGEMLHHGVLDEAEVISAEMAAYEDGERLGWQRLAELFDGMLEKGHAFNPTLVRDTLEDLGLLWRAEIREWEPGIPLLCQHLAKCRGRRPERLKPRSLAAG